MDTLMVIGLIGLAFAWSAATWFVVEYHITSRWEDSYIGRNIMAISATLWVALTNSGLRVVWPDLPGRRIIGTLLVYLIALSIVQRIFAFRRARREGQPETKERSKSDPSQ